MSKPRLAAEIAVGLDPHALEDRQATFALHSRPLFIGEEVRHPEHHAQAEILRDQELAIALLDEPPHLIDGALMKPADKP